MKIKDFHVKTNKKQILIDGQIPFELPILNKDRREIGILKGAV